MIDEGGIEHAACTTIGKASASDEEKISVTPAIARPPR